MTHANFQETNKLSTPENFPQNQYLQKAIEAAKAAGQCIREAYGNVSVGQNKSTADVKDYVTATDLQAEKILRDAIFTAFPGHAILGEELGQVEGTGPFTWVLDPIDGTSNFILGIPMFGISIGIIETDQPYAGVLYDPLKDRAYYGIRGAGAFTGNRRLTASTTSDLADARIALNLGKTRSVRQRSLRALAAIAETVPIIRTPESTAYAVMQMLEGNFDALIDNGDYWDFSASLVLVTEAGGQVTTWQGEEVTPDSKFVLWSNGHLHNQLLSLLSPIPEQYQQNQLPK